MAATIARRVAEGVRDLKDKAEETLDPRDLIKHMLKSYFWLRIVLVVVAVAFPLALLYFGNERGIEWQQSMSRYYHAVGAGDRTNRDIFVGALAATGALLIAYRGHSGAENGLLNVAGALAILVASFPTEWQCTVNCHGWQSIHGYSAIGFFLCIACVAIFCRANTLRYLERLNSTAAKKYRRWYNFAAAAMILFPLWAASRQGHKVFLIELAGIYSFAAYWILKTREVWLIRKLSEEKSLASETSPMLPTPPGAPMRDVPM